MPYRIVFDPLCIILSNNYPWVDQSVFKNLTLQNREQQNVMRMDNTDACPLAMYRTVCGRYRGRRASRSCVFSLYTIVQDDTVVNVARDNYLRFFTCQKSLVLNDITIFVSGLDNMCLMHYKTHKKLKLLFCGLRLYTQEASISLWNCIKFLFTQSYELRQS